MAPYQFMPDDRSGMPAATQVLARLDGDAQQLCAHIDSATSIDDLRSAAQAIDRLTAALQHSGAGIGLTTGLVCELNDRLIARLWALLAPAELLRNSCLYVMGSEGRGEQTLKTDQDNGLLLRDGKSIDGIAELADSFTAALLEFGYPLCPGGIMLSNPLWRQQLAQFRQTIGGWGHDADADGVLKLAIVLDARAIAGDVRLLDDAKAAMWTLIPDSDALLARFTRPIAQFDHPGGGWWHRLVPHLDGHQHVVDLKKSGSFQIVHGVRSLAFKHRLLAVSTHKRLQQLVDRHDFPAALAADLIDALDLLTGWRLKFQLRQRALGRPADNLIDSRDLGALGHAQLAGMMRIVRNFRKYLQQQCPFEMI